MCGRYQFGDDLATAELQKIVEQLNREFAGSPQLAKMKTGEICPTDTAPVITMEDHKEKILLMEWGFPKRNEGGVIINARSETVDERPMFRDALHKRRCLIPATGFFEWQHAEGAAKNIKYLLRLKDEPMLYMAGIYDIVREMDGRTRRVFAILTTDANPFVAPIHDRMPLILEGGAKSAWLEGGPEVSGLLRHSCDAELKLIPA